MTVLTNVTFGFTKIQQADFKYGSQTEKEYSVDCIVDKATAKAWNKEFPKQKAKEVDTSDFEAIYKIAPPFPNQDEQFIIKLRKPAQYKDGTPIPDSVRPRVFVRASDNTLTDVTKDVLVANGSKGVVSYEVNTNDFGTFAKLKAIRVDELIEYKKSVKGANFDELGVVGSLATDFSDIPEREMSETQKQQRGVEHAPDVFDDDIPF